MKGTLHKNATLLRWKPPPCMENGQEREGKSMKKCQGRCLQHSPGTPQVPLLRGWRCLTHSTLSTIPPGFSPTHPWQQPPVQSVSLPNAAAQRKLQQTDKFCHSILHCYPPSTSIVWRSLFLWASPQIGGIVCEIRGGAPKPAKITGPFQRLKVSLQLLANPEKQLF